MSSTGRNKGGKERDPFDFYTTPRWSVRRLFEQWHPPERGRWIEPGAGEGHIIRAVDEIMGFKRPEWTAVELRDWTHMKLSQSGAKHVQIGPYVEWARQYHRFMTAGWVPPFDVAIGNPPFKYAFEFIDASLAIAKRVCFFLRLNFLEGDKRAAWLQTHMPDVYVLPNRVSGTRDGSTDSTAYAWMIFSGFRSSGETRVLNTTPLEERKRDYAD